MNCDCPPTVVASDSSPTEVAPDCPRTVAIVPWHWKCNDNDNKLCLPLTVLLLWLPLTALLPYSYRGCL